MNFLNCKYHLIDDLFLLNDDLFLLNVSERYNAPILTNDQFRDHKADNKVRIPYDYKRRNFYTHFIKKFFLNIVKTTNQPIT